MDKAMFRELQADEIECRVAQVSMGNRNLGVAFQTHLGSHVSP